jgi:hypothetical protein
MSELTLLLLRFGFLLLLWAFVFAVVYALRSDLFGQRVRRMPTETPAASPFPSAAPARPAPSAPPAPPSSAPATSSTAKRLVITSGAKAGMELPLGSEPLTIGRSSESGLVIRDDYTSTHHARLLLWGEDWVLQDLDSTNGTFLDGQRVTVPTHVPLNTPVKIGTTSFELRR